MRPNYLPNPGTNIKNLHKFVNFYGIEPKFQGLVGLRCIFPVINVSPLGLYDGLDPGPEPGAYVLDLVPGHVGPDLVDGGLEGLGVGVLFDVDLGLDVRPYGEVQGIEVRRARRPNIFGPKIDASPEPVLDEVRGVAGGPVLHEDHVVVVVEVLLDPGQHVGLQHQLQVVLCPHPEPDWQVDRIHFETVGGDQAKHHDLGGVLRVLDRLDVVGDVLGPPLGNVPTGAAVGDGVDCEILLIGEQDDGRFFLQLVQDLLASFESGGLDAVRK